MKIKSFKQFINETYKSLKPDDILDITQKLIDEGRSTEGNTINWLPPTDEYAKQEINEIIGNLQSWKDLAYDQTKILFPKTYELLDLMFPNFKDMSDFGEKLTHQVKRELEQDLDVQKEMLEFIHSGKLVDWTDSNVKLTGNMGAFYQDCESSQKLKYYGFDTSLIEKGEESIKKDFFEFVKTCTQGKQDLVNYLVTYNELLQKRNPSFPAPFVVNLWTF